MSEKVNFKFRAFWVRPAFVCEKCTDFQLDRCGVISFLLNNNKDALISCEGRSQESNVFVHMDDMLYAWQAYRNCKKIATNCCQKKTK